MKYYKVIKGDIYDYSTGYTTIKNELVTPRERDFKFKNISNACFKVVEVSKKNIYISFGVRFENGTNHNS